ncbi:MAG: hypothetical protein C4547_02870 [Phycisphaerales bacterium]|nr:MAG: hypothetical protein C4547_02870 [Phycisphaerales bacterium]
MEREQIIQAVCRSACFETEAACLARAGFEVARRPRLFKRLENDKVRLIFPTRVQQVEEGAAVGLVCLYELGEARTVYAHAVFAGPTSNASLRSLFVPETQAKPQPGVAGNKAILQFVAWKQAAWTKFLNDELDLGNAKASASWIENFWKALDRMYGGGNLLDGI